MNDGRKKFASALTTICIAATGASVVTASPSEATPEQPSIGDVRVRVDRLNHEAEQASERYNDARLDLKKAKKQLAAVEKDLDRQRDEVERMRVLVAADVVSSYQGQALSTTSQLVLADDPETFLEQLSTAEEYTLQQTGKVAELALEVDRLQVREDRAHEMIDSITKTRATLAQQKKIISTKADEAKRLLGRLEDERAERLSRSEDRTPVTEVTASGGAAAAIQYAMAQVGDAYVYGAAGPDAFDCSGLTMMAWAAAGVALPHSSGAQMGSGTPVSTSALQPGDLVFYYSPVSHVAMYIGNGQIVHAANPSSGVEVSPVDSMPISGAVRPG